MTARFKSNQFLKISNMTALNQHHLTTYHIASGIYIHEGMIIYNFEW